MDAHTSWAIDRPITSPFAVPKGFLGRLAGRLMLLINKPDELVALLDARAGSRVLEVGFGPGGLVRRLVDRSRAAMVCGVDPSPDMCSVASRGNRVGLATGRVELRQGTAERTGYPDESFDHVVSANNVAIWPDLEASGQVSRACSLPSPATS